MPHPSFKRETTAHISASKSSDVKTHPAAVFENLFLRSTSLAAVSLKSFA